MYEWINEELSKKQLIIKLDQKEIKDEKTCV